MGVSEFLGLMQNTVTVEPATGTGDYGRETYGAAVSYQARITGRHTKVTTFDGREVVSANTVYLAANAVVSPQDRLTLSTGYTGSTEADRLSPPILSVARPTDETGAVHHTAIFLG